MASGRPRLIKWMFAAFVIGLSLSVIFTHNFYDYKAFVPYQSRRFDNITDEEHSAHSDPEDISSESNEHYAIDTPGCKILKLDPFKPDIMKLVPRATLNCTKKPPLVTMEGKVIRVNHEALGHHIKADNPEQLTCCYEEIVRVSQDIAHFNRDADTQYMTNGSCIPFNSTEVVHNYIRVVCHVGHNNEVYRNHYGYPQISPPISEKMNRLLDDYKGKRRPLSVLLVGIDSVSSAHAKRTMPEAIDILLGQGAIELKGYNSVGDGTLPNFYAFLSGQTDVQFRKSCMPDDAIVYDECSFIWQNFSRKGYVTAYAEEFGWLSTFHYVKAGFVRQPVDFYMRTMLLATERELPLTEFYNAYPCHGDRLAVDVVNKYTIDFASTFRDNPYFGLFWTNTLSHESPSATWVAGEPYFRFFQELFQSGSINNTVVVFLSDHGMRIGEIRQTMQGWLEESLPFAYVWFPPWLYTAHPNVMKNLERNSKRLTTPFDLFETFHVIMNDELKTATTAPTRSPFGINLFTHILDNRTCEEAGIIDTHCRCRSFEEIGIHKEEVKKAAEYSLSQINAFLSEFTGCARLTLKTIESAYAYSAKVTSEVTMYLITFSVSPSDALFQAQCIHTEDTNKYELSGEVSRINAYGNQSYCVTNKPAKKFCFCPQINKTMLPNVTYHSQK